MHNSNIYLLTHQLFANGSVTPENVCADCHCSQPMKMTIPAALLVPMRRGLQKNATNVGKSEWLYAIQSNSGLMSIQLFNKFALKLNKLPVLPAAGVKKHKSLFLLNLRFTGIAANGMLAKICSDLNKPNGQFYLENTQEKIVEFMKSLPVRKVPGIGPVSEAVLKALGFETCGDLFANRATIRLLFHKSYSEWLLRISLGISGGDLEQESATDEGLFVHSSFIHTCKRFR